MIPLASRFHGEGQVEPTVAKVGSVPKRGSRVILTWLPVVHHLLFSGHILAQLLAVLGPHSLALLVWSRRPSLAFLRGSRKPY